MVWLTCRSTTAGLTRPLVLNARGLTAVTCTYGRLSVCGFALNLFNRYSYADEMRSGNPDGFGRYGSARIGDGIDQR